MLPNVDDVYLLSQRVTSELRRVAIPLILCSIQTKDKRAIQHKVRSTEGQCNLAFLSLLQLTVILMYLRAYLCVTLTLSRDNSWSMHCITVHWSRYLIIIDVVFFLKIIAAKLRRICSAHNGFEQRGVFIMPYEALVFADRLIQSPCMTSNGYRGPF